MEENKKYQIRIVKSDVEHVIIEENKSKEYIDAIYIWYINHAEFFNGSIQIWYDDKCLVKTNEGK